MNEDNTNQPNLSPSPEQTLSLSGEKFIQPSEAIKQELQAQQLQPPPVTPQPIISPQPTSVLNPTNIYPEPGQTGLMQVGMSASQMGYNQPNSKMFDVNPKKLLVKGLIVLVVLGGIFTALVLTNVIAFSEFKSTAYINSKDTAIKIDFYTKHVSKQLQSGNTQLVSKVTKDGKFPIALSISTTEELSSYNRVKDCASFIKVFEVQNNNLNQKISVCDIGKQGQIPAGSVYTAGFMQDNKARIITISQDYGSIDLSSQSGAQVSLARFGMEPYKADIERIVSSIKVE